jgi:hypothetical protein
MKVIQESRLRDDLAGIYIYIVVSGLAREDILSCRSVAFQGQKPSFAWINKIQPNLKLHLAFQRPGRLCTAKVASEGS